MIMFDFALSKKPCFQFATDIEAYKQDRNFYFEIGVYMVFSSLIFLYAFLPITLMLYAVGKKTNLRNYILLIVSQP